MRFFIISVFVFTLFLFFTMVLNADDKQYKKADIDESMVNETSESFDMKAIPAKIRENLLDIKKCYSSESEKSKKVSSGLVKVNFTIAKSGKTKAINIKSSTLNNSTVENCIMKIISDIQFPNSPEGEIEVNYPFDFTK